MPATPSTPERSAARLFAAIVLGEAVLVPLLESELPSVLLGDQSLAIGLRSALALYVPFLSTTLAVVVVSAALAPRLPPLSWLRDALVRLAGATAIALAVAPLSKPVHDVLDTPVPGPQWLAACVFNTWLIVMPSWAIARLFLERTRRERLLSDARLDALHARLHPHFLFNTLNAFAGLIHENPDRAERVVERLADVLRTTLRSDPRQRVPLHEEVALARDVLFLHGARFEEKLQTHIDVADALAQMPVPQLCLLPLVENAVLHGVATRGQGSVTVRATRNVDALLLDVLDDGPGPGASSHHGTGHALNDLRERLRAVDPQATLTLERVEGNTRARLRLPTR